ncbi:hypothetical protein [Azospirillum melinis]
MLFFTISRQHPVNFGMLMILLSFSNGLDGADPSGLRNNIIQMYK